MKLYRAPYLLTMDAQNSVIEDAGLLVSDGSILAVGEGGALAAAHPDSELIDLPNRVLMPGLINCHMHSGLLRGTAEGKKLWDWLRLYIDPMHRVLTPENVVWWAVVAAMILSRIWLPKNDS